MEQKTIIYEKFPEGFAKIWLNRPDEKNRLNREMFFALSNAIDCAAQDAEIRVIILCAKGEDFCFGFDVGDPETSPSIAGDGKPSWAARRANTQEEIEVFEKILNLKKPIIGATQGKALGGGWMLAMVCDCLVAAENTVYDNNEMALGMSYTMYTPFDAWKLPMNIAMEKAMTGYPTTAEEGYRHGLFNRVVPVDKLDLAATHLAKRMLRLAPYVLTMQKEQYKMAYNLMGLRQIIPFASEVFSISMHLADSPEGQEWNDYARKYGSKAMFSRFAQKVQELESEEQRINRLIYEGAE